MTAAKTARYLCFVYYYRFIRGLRGRSELLCMSRAVFTFFFFFFKQKTAYEIGLGFLLNRSSDLKSAHFYRSAHKFEQICRHRLRRQNVGYSNFSQPQSHLSFCVLLQYLVERRRVVTQLDRKSVV